MKRIARFEKVSKERFISDWNANVKTSILSAEETYDNIEKPKRATSGSAGYDFFSPMDFTLEPGQTIMIPTGIRVWMEEGYVLMMYPRSGYGFKYRFQLNNTVGVIDSDYYYSDNEGHIFARMTNDSNEGRVLEVKASTAFMQGVFNEFFITEDDETETKRNGGLGSTTKH